MTKIVNILVLLIILSACKQKQEQSALYSLDVWIAYLKTPEKYL